MEPQNENPLSLPNQIRGLCNIYGEARLPEGADAVFQDGLGWVRRLDAGLAGDDLDMVRVRWFYGQVVESGVVSGFIV